MLNVDFKRNIGDYVIITIGLLFYAAGWDIFLLPYHITGGGLAGVSALIYYATGFRMQYSYLLMNGVLMIIALRVFGFRFLMKTLYSIFIISFFLAFLQIFMVNEKGVFIQLMGPGQEFMATIVGAALGGIGLGMVYERNGSTGGTDIVNMIMNKHSDISLGRAMQITDFLIVTSCYFVFHSWKQIIFGYVDLLVIGFAVDYYMRGARQSVQFFIFSSKYAEIADQINSEINRGVTILDGMGWYSKEPKKAIVVLARKREALDIFRIIQRIDPKAFVAQSSVRGVFGEGFDTISKS